MGAWWVVRRLEVMATGEVPTLLDRPGISSKEFHEEHDHADWRWTSLLQPPQLVKLGEACPGADRLVSFRKACVGYFIAE